MKRILTLIAFLGICATSSFAQNSAVFYGADFSLVKVYGAGESDAEFALAFNRINELLLTQSAKFNVAKYTRQPISQNQIGVAKAAMAEAFKDFTANEGHTLLSGEAAYDCRPQIDAHIAGYDLTQTDGLGMVILANLLDKSSGRGSFYFVTFDIASRKVINCVLSEGKAKGFGLRNFWANSLYHAMKDFPKNKR